MNISLRELNENAVNALLGGYEYDPLGLHDNSPQSSSSESWPKPVTSLRRHLIHCRWSRVVRRSLERLQQWVSLHLKAAVQNHRHRRRLLRLVEEEEQRKQER